MIRIAHLTVSLERRELYAGTQPVKLGSRAFDILELLIHARGRLVTKDELLAQVWPHSVVEENNLQVHISMLRKVLGNGRDVIRTVPGRGYRLLLDEQVGSDLAPTVSETVTVPTSAGRDHLLIALLQRLGLQDMLDERGRTPDPEPIPYPDAAPGPVGMGPGPKGDTDGELVYIVDDDNSVRAALSRLLNSAGRACKAFCCAEDFLVQPYAEQLGCLVLDVNLQASSGFDLQQELRRRGCQMPIIFMTGYGTIPMSVKAIKAGAQEFLTKPFDESQLLDAVSSALQYARRTHAAAATSRDVRRRFEALTPREREVLALLVRGQINKRIARDLGTREVTIKVHKKHIMTKMNAATLIELVQMCQSIGFAPQALQTPNVL